MSQSQIDLNRLIDELTDATRNKRPVTATYRGHARRLCPHVLGRKGGRWHCLFYQPSGGSRSGTGPMGPAENWLCVPLEDIAELEVVGGRWRTASGGPLPPAGIDVVHAQAPARRPPAGADGGRRKGRAAPGPAT